VAGHTLMGNLCPRGSRYPVATAPQGRL